MADESQDTLSRLMERLARLDKERERLLIAIQVIKNEGGDVGDASSMPPSSESGEPSGIALASQSGPPARRPEIRPDTFFGLSQHQAARRYLLSLGHADRLDNILKVITTGGVEIGGASPLATLRATLAQNSSVFVRVSPGTFGLREFYPQLGNKNEGGRRSSKPKKRPRKPQRSATKAKSASPSQEQEAG